MSLADRLKQTPEVPDEDYRPTVEFDSRGAVTIDTGVVYQPPGQPPEYAQLLRDIGRDPDHFRLVAILYEKHWQVPYRPYIRDEAGDPMFSPTGKPLLDEQQFRWAASYKLHVEPINADAAPNALDDIVRAARVERRAGTGPSWFVFQAGDLQIGKRSRDGATDQIVERFVQSVEAAVDEFKASKRFGVEGIQVSFPGDCIEGNQSQNGRNLWLTQETITEQVLIFQRLIMFAVEAFAPLTERVFVDVVNGNHDEAQRQQNTYPGNGWATKAATSVWDSLKLHPLAFSHVDIRIPDKWSGSLTVPVGDTVVTVAHGHQWRRDKAFDWWANQAIGNHAPGGAQILQHGHWHEWMVRSNADRTVVCSPTFDCGSDWFRETKGGTSRRGAVTYLLRSGEVSRMGIV